MKKKKNQSSNKCLMSLIQLNVLRGKYVYNPNEKPSSISSKSNNYPSRLTPLVVEELGRFEGAFDFDG